MQRILLIPVLLLLACDDDDNDDNGGGGGGGGGENLIDGILLPDPDGVTWVEGVDNPYFPLPIGASWFYSAQTADGVETDQVTVTDHTKVVNGVNAVVVYDAVFEDGAPAEETHDWYAQDSEGNVWYLGEDTCSYVNGACTDTEGSWEWGVDGALPGIVMPANPTVDGQPYFQEYYEGEAEDVGEVIGTGETIDTPAGRFTNCIRTADTSHIEDIAEEKVYCPGIGNVYEQEQEAEVFLQTYSGL